MQTVTMDQTEWGQLMAVLANAQGPGITWSVVNPLLMKLGEQLRVQAPGQVVRPGNGLDPDEVVQGDLPS